jgi:hypothetical protein
MPPYLITQREADARLLCKLLGPKLSGRLRVDVAEVWSDCVSRARSRLGEGHPVALVLDAGSRKALKVAKHRDFLRFALTLVAPDFMWRVILIQPELPRLYFREPSVLRQLVGHEPTEAQLARARSKPRRVLAELLGVPLPQLDAELCRRLETVDVSPLAPLPSMQRLRRFLQSRTESRSPFPGLR